MPTQDEQPQVTDYISSDGEQELHPSEEKFRRLFQSMPLPVYTWQRRGEGFQLTDYNTAADEFTDGAIVDFVGLTASEMYSDRPDIVEDISRCFSEEADFQREMDYTFKSTGEDKKLVANYVYVPPDLVLVQTEDVTKLQTALEEASFERDVMQSILDTSLDTIVVIDAQTMRYLKWNKAAARTTGYSDEEIPTIHPLEDFFDEAELPHAEAAMEALLREGTVTMRLTHVNKDGSRTLLDYTGAVSKDMEGDPKYLIFIGRDVTERKREEDQLQQEIATRKKTEQNLQSQVTLFNCLLETVPDTITIRDPVTYELIERNDAARRISGYSDEEFATLHPVADFFDEADGRRVEAAVDQAMREGSSIVTVDMIAKDGRRIPMEFTGLLASDAEGKPLYFIAIGRDVTERIEAEEALKASEEELQSQAALLRDIFETNIDTIEIFDPESKRYIMWNQAVNEISGFTDEEIAEMDPIRDFIQEPELSETLKALEKTVEEGEAATRTVVISKEGSRIPMEYRTSLVENPEGDPIYIIAIGRDISEQAKLEEALRKSEAMYRDLVENISDVLYAIDTEGLVTYVSPAIEPFLGLPPESLIGQPFAQFVLPEDLDLATDNVQQLMSGNSPGPNEYRVMHASGEIRWIRVSSRPIISEGRVTGMQGVMTDITAVKRAEEQLEKSAALAERQRLARELHDSVTQTLYGIDLHSNATHEALTSGKVDSALGNVGQIQALGRSALADMRLLIFELQPPILIKKGLAVALRERLDLVEARAGFNTSLRVTSEEPISQAIEAELYAIATEALNNTLKHAQAEHVGVVLEVDEQFISLEISDDGIGFDPDAADKSKGFGLSNMRERADRLGATFNMAGILGEGTTVRVEAPV